MKRVAFGVLLTAIIIASPRAETDTLIAAVGFALTGSDNAKVQVINRTSISGYHMAVVAGVIFFIVRAFFALIPGLPRADQEMGCTRRASRHRLLSHSVRQSAYLDLWWLDNSRCFKGLKFGCSPQSALGQHMGSGGGIAFAANRRLRRSGRMRKRPTAKSQSPDQLPFKQSFA
jgi:hypothetical protein